jgi:hypothetical protein
LLKEDSFHHAWLEEDIKREVMMEKKLLYMNNVTLHVNLSIDEKKIDI